MSNELEKIERQLEQTEDDEITISLLYQKIDILQAKANKYDSLVEKIKNKIAEINKDIEKYREYTEQGIETDTEWVDNVANRQIVKVLQELLDTD